jgi:lipopolysaccharide transport system ATP-binding protein
MKDIVIDVENVGKSYRLAHKRSGNDTLRDSIMCGARAFTSRLLRGNNSEHLPEMPGTEEFWALRDISFQVPRGQALGLIGRNGAGKSTMLKLLSRITEPTTGRIRLRGRITSLLEVGTGFHPELTGRENIFLNGAILGMKRVHIRDKFDEIVAFGEIEKFLDTPVKHYSSGMYVRLAFAVAAHLEPEILIVDEVIAVGDAAFQRKCIGKMQNVAKQDRTVVFVSHNMATIRALCSRAIVLDQGRITYDASAQNAATCYLKANQGTFDVTSNSLRNRLTRTSGAVRFTSIRFEDDQGCERPSFEQGTTVRITLTCLTYRLVPDLGIIVAIRGGISTDQLTSIKTVLSETELRPHTELKITLTLPAIPLRPGDYSLYICLGNKQGDRFHDVLDKNVSLPTLSITSDETDLHTIAGYFSIPWDISVATSEVA